MATHLKFVQGIIYKPIFVLKKDHDNVRAGRKTSVLVPSVSDAYISDIITESVADLSNPSKNINIRRVFVTSVETQASGYNNVGWALNDDISICMLCRSRFGMRNAKHHCKACGNIFCQSCASSRVVVVSLEKVGPLRVCNLCYYGQELVEFCPNRPVTLKKEVVDRNSYVAPASSTEDRIKQMKQQQQQEFQKDALARIQQSPSIAPKLIPQSKKFVSVNAVSTTPDETVNGVVMTANPMLLNKSTSDRSSVANSPIASLGGNNIENGLSDREKQYLSFGSMSVIVPTAGFVMKTKRSNGLKVFVNVCSHENIPYKTDRLRNAADIDSKKLVYMILNVPQEHQNEKDSSKCVIYDVVVSPEEMIFCSNDSSGAAKHRLCCQALEFISTSYSEKVDPQYVILRLATNYKGGEDGKLSIRSCYCPSKEAFISLHQIVATPVPLIHNAPSVNDFDRASSSSRFSMGSVGRGSASFSNESIFDSFSNNPQGIQRLLKAIIVPRVELDKLMERNFNPILEAINSYEVEMKDVIVYPEAGFVILAQQIKPVRKIYINICHHPSVGIRTPEIDSITPEMGLLKPCPFILGEVSHSNPSENPGIGKAMIIDLVIPTNIMLLVIADSSGNLRDELAIEILQRLSAMNVILDANFALPVVSGGYVTATPSNIIKIPPVINLTEAEKASYCPCFIGKLFKQGHRFKTWKERLIFFSESKMQYFDLKMSFQGDFEIEECSVEDLSIDDCAAPKASFPFQIKNHATGGEYMNCYVLNSQYKELIALLFKIKLNHIEALKTLINIPSIKTGYLKKQGHLIRNWKLRYFILNYGILSYYENNGAEKVGLKEQPKGKVVLKNATVSVVLNDEVTGKQLSQNEFRIQIVDQENNKLLLEMKNIQERKEWFDSIKKHIEYARDYLD